MIPIPKKGNLSQVSNFRPISLLPLPGKIFEKVVHEQLLLKIEEDETLSDLQFGFRKGKSTIQAIHKLTEQINIGFNNSLLTAAVYIDFKKAFDCVQYPTLLQKLGDLELSDLAMNWIKSYLSNRFQRVLANGKLSKYLPVTQGVPQGSILGPLFYILYANDLPLIFRKSKYIFYADDTVLYTQGKNAHDMNKILQSDLTRLQKWCNLNSIFVNSAKTKYMIFGSRNRVDKVKDLNLYIDKSKIDRVNKYTYLGVSLDPQLNFEDHAAEVISRVSAKIYQLKKIRPVLTDKAALLIYKNMILPILEYGDVFFSSVTLETKKQLQKLQNRALKCALRKDRLYGTKDLHSEAKLNTLKWRRKQHLGQLMFQITSDKIFWGWRIKLHRMTTRNGKKKQIDTKKPVNEKFKKSVTYQGMKLWNSLPLHIQKQPDRIAFKTILKKHITSTESGTKAK